MGVHALQCDAYRTFTEVQAATSITWGLPIYVGSLTQNRTLALPTLDNTFPDSETLLIYLRANAGGFLWTLANYDLGEDNQGNAIDGSTIQSTVATKVDLLICQRLGNSVKCSWRRGFNNVSP